MNNQSPTCIPCGIQTFQRNTFFNGKLLTERDLNAEQAYMVGKDRLHNSLLHGLGTVCGLKVVAHPNPECRDQYVVIEPGVALDCCGREIIVPQKILAPILAPIEQNDLVIDPNGADDLFISLCYQEQLNELIPVLLPDCDCADANQAYNRVREQFRIHLYARPAGQQAPARPPLNARLDWLHTLTLARQSPRALVVDDQVQQLYVAAQAIAPDAEEAEPELRARLYAFHTDNHDLIAAVDAGDDPTDLALSVLGDRIYLATSVVTGESSTQVVAVFEESKIRSEPAPTKRITLPGAARLLVSPLTRALYALVLDNAGQSQLLRWSDEAIAGWLGDPAPDLAAEQTLPIRDPLDGRSGAGMATITLDGKFIFIADATHSRILAVDIASSTVLEPAIDIHGQPLAVAASRDSKFLYVLWNEAANTARLSRYQLDTTGALVLHEDGRGARWAGAPADLVLAPNERWAYVLQASEEQGEVQAIDIDELAKPGADPVDARGTRERVSGTVSFERLAVMGGRIYVAAEDEATDQQPERGLVAVLDVQEEACDDRFIQVVDGCPACSSGSADEHCVVIATLPRYKRGALNQNAGDAGDADNLIDNLTHRPLVPSTNTIVDVIRCLLEQGLAEGVPGPRGPAGASGEPGADGAPGAAGPRGPGITDVTVTTAPPGVDASATLEDITGDPEGDQRLVLTVPRGEQGDQGPAGPLDDPDVTRIVGLSWVHDAELRVEEFEKLIMDPLIDDTQSPREAGIGLVILFSKEVHMRTLIKKRADPDLPVGSEVFQLYVRLPNDNFNVDCECQIPQVLCQPVKVDAVDAGGLITAITPQPDLAEGDAVRLVLRHTDFGWNMRTNPMFLRVVLRADFVLDLSDKAVDGNNIGGLTPRRPSGNGRQGDTFESWFTVRSDGQ